MPVTSLNEEGESITLISSQTARKTFDETSERNDQTTLKNNEVKI